MPTRLISIRIMPEGHTIHRAAIDQRPWLTGHVLKVISPQGRFADGARLLDGRCCLSVEAYGKHLLYGFEEESWLHIHLGLFGRFRTSAPPAPEPRGAVRVRLESGERIIDINGPNRCEVLDRAGFDALCARIGPDVLRADADHGMAHSRIARSRTAIGQLLMDQSVIAGIGNIYRSEVLWRCGIHPMTPGHAIDEPTFATLWQDAQRLLAAGVRANAIITTESALAKPGRGRYRERVNIFGKGRCPRCDGPVSAFELAGRRVYACDTCQPSRPLPAARAARLKAKR